MPDFEEVTRRNRTPIRKAAEVSRVVRHTLPIDVLVRTLEWVRQRLAPNDFFLREVIETSPV